MGYLKGKSAMMILVYNIYFNIFYDKLK